MGLRKPLIDGLVLNFVTITQSISNINFGATISALNENLELVNKGINGNGEVCKTLKNSYIKITVPNGYSINSADTTGLTFVGSISSLVKIYQVTGDTVTLALT